MDIHQLLGKQADSLLGHTCKGIPKDSMTYPRFLGQWAKLIH